MELVQKILQGDTRAAARLMSLVENGAGESVSALKSLYPHTGKAYVVGVTGPPGSGKSTLVDGITEELRRTFRPEFLNRIDEIIIFRPLTSEQIKSIVDILISRVRRELRGQNMDLELSEAAKDVLAKEGFDPTFGARPLRRAIQRLVEDQLSDELLRGNFSSGDTVLVDASDGKFVFTKKRAPEPALKGD